MAHLNVEFKAITHNLLHLEEQLKTLHPIFKGEDHQLDTYFNTGTGRLKLREGNIENALIWYDRANISGSKQSHILLYQHQPDNTLKQILIKPLGIKIVVDKCRRIYFIDNVKFHFDTVKGLGNFIEVEAIDAYGSIGLDKITEQCNYYASFFNINSSDFQSLSYSDMLEI